MFNVSYEKINKLNNNTNLIRVLLLGGVLVYILYGFLFRTGARGTTDIFSSFKRYISAFILLSIFLSSFFSEYVKKYLVPLTIYFALFASLQLIADLHFQNYPLDHTQAMFGVIILINLLFNRIKLLLFYNITILTVTSISIFTVNKAEVHRYYFLMLFFIIILMSFIFAFIRKKQANKIKEQQKKYKELVNNTSDHIYSINAEGFFSTVNDSFCQELDLSREKILGKKPSELDLQENFEQEFTTMLNEVFSQKEKREREIEFFLVDNTKKYYKVELIPIFDEDDNIKRIRGMNRDITQRKKTEERIRYLNFHDQLTGLYNRRYFENEIERLNKSRRLPISIVMADLDGLKFINDNYGHETGDEFIKKTGEIFSNCVREADIVARVGGDEFAIILPQTNLSNSHKLIKRIQKETENFNKNSELPEPLKISLGAAAKTSQTENLNEIFDQADKKMYANKGRSRKNLS